MQQDRPPDRDAAEQLLAETTHILAHQRESGRALMAGRNLIVWGVAWMLSYPALDLLPELPGLLVALVPIVIAALLSWIRPGTTVRTGFESRIQLGWIVVLCASPFLVATVAPLEATRAFLLLGSLWCLVMALTGVAVRDRPLFAVGFSGVVVAGLAPAQQVVPAATLFGIVGALPFVALGVWRVVRAARHERTAAGEGAAAASTHFRGGNGRGPDD